MTERKTLRLAIPNGNLQQATVELFCKAGYDMKVPDRSYFPTTDDPEIECMLVRPQEQPRYVQDGIIDAGITGYDWIQETGAKVVEVAEMVYSKVSRRPTRWVFVVPDESPVRTLKDLEGKRIATELTNLTRAFLEARGISALVEYSFGATEVKPGLLADAIVDATETGSSLKANNLRIIETLIESTPRLIASPQAWDDPWKRQKIEDIALMLRAVMNAEGKVWLSMNARREDLDAVLAILPALDKPTVASLSDPAWVDVTTIVDETVVREIVPKLKKAGAHGIVEYPLNKIID
ncbi:MAG TPA: ATP phosphoribosyltransferase [Dehalococcoidia bacterium]|nr:ATP phosphoribosyltransferase [Dehalococcoidia bacterium]